MYGKLLIAKGITFCGGNISAEGVLFSPRSLKTLKTLQPPQTGADLYQLLGAVG